MKRAVIYFGFNNPRGHKRGVENVIEIQAAALPGFRKYYVFFDSQASVGRWGRIVSIGIKYGALRFFTLNVVVALLLRRLKRNGYDTIVHSHNYLMSLFLFRRSDLFSVHDGLWYQKKTVGSRIPLLFYFIERLVYSRTNLVHCNSWFTYRKSLLSTSGKCATVIYCSTPFERYREDGLRAPIHLPGRERVMVLSVRSIEPRARIDLLIHTAQRAHDRGLPFNFYVAGKGPLLEDFRREIGNRQLGNIELLGYVNDSELVRLYAGCELVLMTCEHGEGFGLPSIEGYLFGKPVIASNRCAVPEVLISREDLVENNPDEILDRLVAVQTSPTASENFVSYYRTRFSNQVITGEFEQLYRNAFELGRGWTKSPSKALNSGI